MNQSELLQFMKKTYAECLETARKKNTDYAGESGVSPFANFEASTVVGVPVERGMLVRLMDKIKRISNLLDQDARVVDESVLDSIDDGINYLCLLKAYLTDLDSQIEPMFTLDSTESVGGQDANRPGTGTH